MIQDNFEYIEIESDHDENALKDKFLKEIYEVKIEKDMFALRNAKDSRFSLILGNRESYDPNWYDLMEYDTKFNT